MRIVSEDLILVKPRGDRRPDAEIEKNKAEMFSLFLKGYTKKAVLSYFKEKGIGRATIIRYWNGLFEGQLKDFLPTLNRDLESMRARALERIKDCRLALDSATSFEERQVWMDHLRKNEEFYLKFFQAAGILKNESTTINIGIKAENVIVSEKEPLEEFIELNKKHLRDLIDSNAEPSEITATV